MTARTLLFVAPDLVIGWTAFNFLGVPGVAPIFVAVAVAARFPAARLPDTLAIRPPRGGFGREWAPQAITATFEVGGLRRGLGASLTGRDENGSPVATIGKINAHYGRKIQIIDC